MATTTISRVLPLRSYRFIKSLRNIILYIILIAFAVYFAFPIIFMLFTSFKVDEVQVMRDLSSLNAFVPYGSLGLGNYLKIFARIDFARYLINSFIIIGFQLSISLLVNSMVAFSLSRLSWKGRNVLLAVIIALIIIPPTALTVPLLQLVNWFNWFDSYQVIIVPFLVVPLHIFLFYQFFIGIPKDFDEAAIIDGASYWQIYTNVILPLSRPVFATVMILGFLAGWGNYLWPLLTCHSPDYWPIMVGLGYFLNQSPAIPAQIMAYISMVTIPVLIVFAFFQKWFIQSVASSGIKG